MSRSPFKKFLNIWSRKLHRWGAILTLVPMVIVIVTGILLQVKKEFAWIQPPTARGNGGELTLTFPQILEAAKTVPEVEVTSWADVDRLDVRPDKGVVKVRAINGWETQIDLNNGEVLQTMQRRSDLIETIHDGSWFHDSAKLWIFLPNGIILFALWCTGVYLWLIPILSKRKGKARRAALNKNAPSS